MKVHITLVGPLGKYLNDMKAVSVDLPMETAVSRVIQIIKIPEKGFSMITVNGQKVAMDYVLKDQDTVTIFPLVSGG